MKYTEDFLKTIGRIIRTAREKKNWTQKQLAEKLYVQPPAVSNWERGRNGIDLETAKKLDSFLETHIYDTLKARKEEKKSMIPDAKIKKLDEIDSVMDLSDSISVILANTEIDDMFKTTISNMLQYTLFTVLGYEIYYSSFERAKDPDMTLDWGGIAYYLRELLNKEELWPIPRETSYPFSNDDVTAKKIEWMSYQIGSVLFEDFDEETGYRNGYMQQVGRIAEQCGLELRNVFPAESNPLHTAYKMAIIDLYTTIDRLAPN